MDASGGGAAGVEVQGEEADGEMEGFAGDLVAVDEAAPVPVDGDEAEGGGRAGDFAPVGGVGLGVCGCRGGREVAVLVGGGGWRGFLGGGGFSC